MARITSLALLATAALAGCGGGNSTTEFDARSAQAAYTRLNGTWDLTGTGSDGLAYRYVTTYTPAGERSFAPTGSPARTRVVDRKSSVEGQPDVSGRWTDYYSLIDDTEIGTVYSFQCLIADTANAPPQTARVGDSGVLHTQTAYRRCDLLNPDPVPRVTQWSIEEHDDIDFYCVEDFTESDAGRFSLKKCFETDATGTLRSRAIWILDQRPADADPVTVEAKNY